MGRPRKTQVDEGKQKIIDYLIEEYEVETPKDIYAALRDLLGPTIQNILESEIQEQMKQSQKEEPEYSNSRNGYKPKTLKSNYGEVPIKVPQDRNSDFEPKVVPKHKRDISEIEGQIISMYAKGMSTRQISDQVQDIYGFEVSESLVTGITNKLMPEIEEWQKRPLSTVYPIVFIATGMASLMFFFIFALALMCVPSTNTTSGARYPAYSTSSSIHSNIFSTVSAVNRCRKL